MEEGLRAKLVENDEIALDMEADVDMESLVVDGVFTQQNSSYKPIGASKRTKGLSMTSILPSMQLSWHNISAKPRREKSAIPFMSSLRDCFTDSNGFEATHQKYILENVFGVAYPGEVLALMGASGAGKTTLLNILTQRNLNTVKASGYIRLNGYDVDKNTLRKISAYVQQDDLFVGTMTVIEHLRFMATLRMGKHYSKEERERRVQSVMRELGLGHCANTIIGWPHRLRGLSGGERKRLAFASEIMTGPPILFCDEPTSGLDSYLAQQVIQVLKDLAQRKNMTIVVTIHQPSSQVFEMFDKVCLLADGRLSYLGTIDEAIGFFNSLDYPLPENFNPADHFISTLAVHDASNKGRKAKARVKKICDAFLNSDVGRKVFETSKDGDANTVSNSASSTTGSNSGQSLSSDSDVRSNLSAIWKGNEALRRKTFQSYKATWFQQFWAITKRSFFVTLREPMLLRVRIIQTILIALLLGAFYFNTKLDQSTVMNINGLLFQAIGNMNFMFQFPSVHIFCDELPIFMREHLSILYRVDAYFIGKNVAELPQYLTYPIIFATIIYWMTGLVRDFTAYLLFVLSSIMVANVAISISYAMACIFATTSVAIAVLPIFVIPLLAFGGFYINQASLPWYFYPLKYLSYFGYGYETTAIAQWTRVDYIPGCNTTSASKFASTSPDYGGLSPSSNWQCYGDGQDVLDSISFSSGNLIPDFLAMLAMILVFRLIAFIALLTRAITKK